MPGNVNFCFEGVSVKACCFFWSRGICASSGSACASVPWIQAMYFSFSWSRSESPRGSLRISLDISNTEEEIDYMLEVIPRWWNNSAECQMIGGKSIARD